MRNKTGFLAPILLVAAVMMIAIPAFANHGYDHGSAGKVCPLTGESKSGHCSKTAGPACSSHGKQCKKGGACEAGKSGCPIAARFCKHACWLMGQKDELGLSDAQITKIKSLELESKKTAIKAAADMQIGMLEMNSMLGEEVIDVNGLESMIDSGMASMALTAKANVRYYSELKALLTDDQKAKMKAMKKASHS